MEKSVSLQFFLQFFLSELDDSCVYRSGVSCMMIAAFIDLARVACKLRL